MPRLKYTYNPETCKYEPFYVRGRLLRNRVMTFLSISFLVAVGGYFWLVNHYVTIDEMMLDDRNQQLKVRWDILRHRVDKANKSLAVLIDKDDNNYRVILDSPPLPASIREAGVGGSERINHKLLKDFPIILKEYTFVEKLKHKVDVQVQSFREIERMLNTRLKMWAARPAIQPLNNEDVTYLHTRYGDRYHQILGYVREHKGLDFSADVGTPVYATGDGRVKQVYYSDSYGKVIFIDHHYGYETRYAHLSGFNVKAGQRVKRGEIIGFVGSTGLSAGPHLHYEVLYMDEHTNPINFFQRDLSNSEYERLIELAAQPAEPLD